MGTGMEDKGDGVVNRYAFDQLRTRHRRVSQVEADRAHWREQIRAVIRGYLREVVNLSRALGVALLR